MTDERFIMGLSLALAALLAWGFRALPAEKWQMMAAIPKKKNGNQEWIGENLTFYGVLNANAYTFATAILILLLGAVNMPGLTIFLLGVSMLTICIPCSRIIARIVEKKRFTFTTGGASFAGMIAAPLIVFMVNEITRKWIGYQIDMFTFLAAVSIAYTFGEGVGRLACISFGCCYGKPVSQCSPMIQKLFGKIPFVFYGKTKKIAYASQLDGEKVVPIQAVTSVIYCLAGVLGLYLFLKGYMIASFFMTLITTQAWRYISEFFRADYRGDGKISAYQLMGIISIAYAVILAFLFTPSLAPSAHVMIGLSYLWRPETIILLQALWIVSFLYTGRSKVTGSSLSFYVIQERI